MTTALYKHHLPLQGYSLLLSTARHTFEHALGTITEVFSGTNNVWPQEAVSHQGFSSAGVVLPFVRGLLGLEGDTLDKKVTFSPHFPADWKQVSIDNYSVGQAKFSFDYSRDMDKIKVNVRAENAEGYKIHFAPALGIGSKIQSLTMDGKPLSFQTQEKSQVVIVKSEIPVLENAMTLELQYALIVEVLPAVPQTEVGDRNKGLKIISLKKEASHLVLQVEGLANKTYELGVMNPEGIANVDGAQLLGNKLVLSLPDGEFGQFIPLRVILHLKKKTLS